MEPLPVVIIVLVTVKMRVAEVDRAVESSVRVGVELIPVVAIVKVYPEKINLALSPGVTPWRMVVTAPFGKQLLLGGLVCGVSTNVTATHCGVSEFTLTNEH
jgi:hypothetical protein